MAEIATVRCIGADIGNANIIPTFVKSDAISGAMACFAVRHSAPLPAVSC